MPLHSPVYADLEPREVWRHFDALNAIPRPSGREEEARQYVQKIAVENGAMWKTDARGNICVRVGARGPQSVEGKTIVVLQSHLDMVCQKRPDVAHDFERDAITPRRLGDKIYASGTTLGADNGIGAAMMLAVLSSPDVVNGPLELLFTVEEETGLYGAALLDPEIVRGQTMINLDSEDPDEITIGCAGGAGTTLHLPLEREKIAGLVAQKLTVGGLAGGHSGMQIHEPLGNAIKILAQILAPMTGKGARLISLEGGTAHNAIPRDASAVVAFEPQLLAEIEAIWQAQTAQIEKKWRRDEAGLFFGRELAAAEKEAPLSLDSTRKLVGALENLPHGVQKMSERFAGKVQTSSNLAEAKIAANKAEIHVSNRSFLGGDMEQMQELCARIGH